MRNRYLEKMDSIVKIKVVGSNIHNYLKRMMKNKIQMLRVIPISRKEIHILLKYSEYQKLLQYRSIYEISVLQFYGKLRFREKLRKHFILFLFLTIGIIFIFFLSKIVFVVEVVHSDREIREFLEDELQKYGISKYSLKKSLQAKGTSCFGKWLWEQGTQGNLRSQDMSGDLIRQGSFQKPIRKV